MTRKLWMVSATTYIVVPASYSEIVGRRGERQGRDGVSRRLWDFNILFCRRRGCCRCRARVEERHHGPNQ
jgi:hypothetical protein